MNNARINLLFVLVVLTLFGFTIHAQEANLTDGCVSDYDAETDYFPDKVDLEHTVGFTVEYHSNYKLVTVTNPWPGAEDDDIVQYVLVQCGTPAPEQYQDALIIETPIKTLAAMSTTYLPYIQLYGLIDNLVAVDTLNLVSTPSIVEKGASGELSEFAPNYQLNIESALDASPDVTMFYGFGFETDSYLQLEDAGLRVVLNGEFAETDPLARAEWGKFLALFFNQEAIANATFDEMIADYHQLTALAETVQEQPTVFVNAPFDGTWYMAGGDSYIARFLSDAGADYLWSHDLSATTLFLDFEAVYDTAADADFWVNADQFWFSPDDAIAADERFGDFMAFQNDNVWSNNLALNENFGNDFFESGVAFPNLILADLIAIFHPDLLSEHEFTYYRKLESGD